MTGNGMAGEGVGGKGVEGAGGDEGVVSGALLDKVSHASLILLLLHMLTRHSFARMVILITNWVDSQNVSLLTGFRKISPFPLVDICAFR